MKLMHHVAGIASGFVLGAAASAFAAPHAYQYTGVVTATSSTKLDVDKGGEVWDFAVDESTRGAHDVKSGDKVTVTYRMLATHVDKKP